MNVVRSFVNYASFRELCDRMRFEVDCAKSHHRVISEGLISKIEATYFMAICKTKWQTVYFILFYKTTQGIKLTFFPGSHLAPKFF